MQATPKLQFIIGVQRTHQQNLKRRMLYYGSKLIADQAPKGSRREWGYNISEVYVIVRMDRFTLPGGDDREEFLHVEPRRALSYH